MHSPFAGMDPFIEGFGFWEDFHLNLIAALQGAIARNLPDRYVVRAGERSYVVLSARQGTEEFLIQPDLGITNAAEIQSRQPNTSTAAAILEAPAAESAPITMRALVETEHREGFLEIRELNQERTLITCIEILSPSNKRAGSHGWLLYNRKRQAFLEGAAHFVEIDLLRDGRRMPMQDEWPNSPYYVLVSRKHEAPRSSVWPAYYAHPLPSVPVPLVPPDADITVALQPLVDAVYDRSRYDRDIDYRRALHPELPANDLAWLKERLSALQA